MHIYFVRHAQSILNEKNIHQYPDTPLSEKGKEQATLLAKRLVAVPADHIISSTYERARQTAALINTSKNLPINESPLFCERKRPTIFEGKAFADPLIQPIKEQILKNFDNPSWRYSDEETFFDIKKRAEDVLSFLASFLAENLIVVTHGDFLRMIIGVMLFGERVTPFDYLRFHDQMILNNTGITICDYDGVLWKLRTWNDTTHLPHI